MRVEFYDTTLRDGAQSEDIAFTLTDKLRITEKLDEFGMHYIEGGWPGSNPKDLQYFKEVKKLGLKNAKIVAFSSTMKANTTPENDEIIKALMNAHTEYITIVGKSWDLHVKDALRVSMDTNLRMIERTIAYLKKSGKKVFFDAEHFFDGYKKNKAYATQVIETAYNAGADAIVLCDTNGGSMPYEVYDIVGKVHSSIKRALGIADMFRLYVLIGLRIPPYGAHMDTTLMGKSAFANIGPVFIGDKIGHFINEKTQFAQFLELFFLNPAVTHF